MNLVNQYKIFHSANYGMYACEYHIIFCTKFNRKLFSDEQREFLKTFFESYQNSEELADQEINLSFLDLIVTPTYVHMYVRCSPNVSILSVVKKMKTGSASAVKKEFPKLETQSASIWTKRSLIMTAGDVSLEDINSYIEEERKS